MPEPLQKILLVDDDEELCELLRDYLQTQGLQADYVTHAEAALNRLQDKGEYSALVLDIMMPGMDGLDLLKLIRQKMNIPVIMLTGKGDDIDRIIGLELGADDYMGKPCNPRELTARIKAVLRRAQNVQLTDGGALPSPAQAATLNLKELILDSNTLSVTDQSGRDVLGLTGVEFKILYLLTQKLGHIVSKEEICEQVLNRKLDAYDRSVDVHISRIRHKLMEHAGMANPIKSVRGLGYQLSLPKS